MSEVAENARGKKKRKGVKSGPEGSTAIITAKQACTACRQRKIRCDAVHPSCGYCATKQKACVYPSVFKRASCSQSHVETLETKVKEFERALDTLAYPDTQQLSSPPRPPLNEVDRLGYQSGQKTDMRPPNPYISLASEGLALESTHPAQDAVTISSPIPRQHDLRKRYGKSSTLHYALNVRASATAMEGESSGSPPNRRRRLSISSERSNGIDTQSISSQAGEGEDGDDESVGESAGRFMSIPQLLPHRHLAKLLFGKYFEAVHPIWPFLLEDESRELFDQMWTSDDPPNSLWMVQINLIMCLGCQHYEGKPAGSNDLSGFDAMTSGKDFYHRAQGYVYANAFTRSSIGMLQALLLMAQYQQGAMRSNECYLTIGHAARMAQSLGLHISRPESASVAPQQRELHRRLWWGCFCLDRISSMIFGRPMGIPYGQFSDYQDGLPQQVDDQYIVQGQAQPSQTPSVYSFFHHSVRLYHVMDDILLRLRNAKATAYHELQNTSGDIKINRPVSNINSMISLLNAILSLDGHLLSWHEYVPDCLRFDLRDVEIAREHSSWLQRQAHVLRSRFLGMRILLHRQTILFLLQPPERRSWPQNGVQEWPPLFSDCNNDTLVGGSTLFRQYGGTPSPVETILAQLSASICVSSAILQIEATETHLSSRLTGEWWWDFNFTFNAVCVLCGALALHRRDLVSVIPDPAKARDIIRRGFGIIRLIGSSPGGFKVRQSEKFLQKLVRATLRRSEKERSSDIPQQPPPLPQPQPQASALPTTTAPSQIVDPATYPSSGPHHPHLLPTPNQFYGTADMPYNATGSNVDWTLDMRDLVSSWTDYDAENPLDPSAAASDFLGGSSESSSDNVETLFHNSFGIWAALGDSSQAGGMPL